MSLGGPGEPLRGVSSFQGIELVGHAPQHHSDRRAAQDLVAGNAYPRTTEQRISTVS